MYGTAIFPILAARVHERQGDFEEALRLAAATLRCLHGGGVHGKGRAAAEVAVDPQEFARLSKWTEALMEKLNAAKEMQSSPPGEHGPPSRRLEERPAGRLQRGFGKSDRQKLQEKRRAAAQKVSAMKAKARRKMSAARGWLFS